MTEERFTLTAPTAIELVRLIAARETETHRCVVLDFPWRPFAYAANCVMRRRGE